MKKGRVSRDLVLKYEIGSISPPGRQIAYRAAVSNEHTILFKPKNKKTSVPAGTTILSAAIEIGLKIRHNCGGNATCGTCRVHIEEGMENLSPVNEREMDLLGEDRIANHHRL